MKPRVLHGPSGYCSFYPSVTTSAQPIILLPDEAEALRLVDHLGMSQEEAAQSMEVSRGTVWRCVDSGRRKLIAMLVEGRALTVAEIDLPEQSN